MKGGVSEETIWAIVEAYLFEMKNTASTKDFVDLFNSVFTEEELDVSLEKMEKSRWDARRGIVLVCRKGLWALEVSATPAIIKELKIETEDNVHNEWSDGEKTVLAIVAYEGPVSSARIDEIMGVDCSHYITSLQERGLVKRKSNKCVVTPSFFGLSGLQDSSKLPSLDDKEDMQSQNDPKNGKVNFSHFDCSLTGESAVGFDCQWLD
ncbi:MAG: SMC-Scp complex subunit ScpB [Oligoflexia bacterium]|nr:SMC-Scp complex subunit ScpB [Oligoflexia bacterium]